ncbi:MAG: hypothetical protein C0618_00450 [Desulfuromonas sp.]|nr:MAG: hypothetical protein C0618_00450 [Desulfuromonas sp.]
MLNRYFIHLKAAGLIRGRRGRNGGYLLLRLSGEITILLRSR